MTRKIKMYNTARQIQQLQKMITIDKITVQVGSKIFTENTKKLLKIQAQNQLIKTKNSAKPISQTNLQWEQSIDLPLVYGQSMPFEVYQKHQFGYNPEQIQSVLHGTIVFVQGNQKFNNFEIFDLNQKKIGYLSVNIKNKPVQALSIQKSNDQLTATPLKKKIVDETQLVVISSIIANIPSIKAKRAYAIISIGSNQAKTSPGKSKSGELVFIQKYELEKNTQVTQGTIEIIGCLSDQPDQKIATASFLLQKRIDRKLKFFDSQNQQAGEGFIDGKVQLKTQALANRLFASIIKDGFQKEFSHSQSNAKTFKDLSRSVLSNSGLMRSHGSEMSKSGKKMSILNHNTNIRFSQEKRFFNSRDLPNNKCSYLQQRQRSFEFKEKNVDKYYRGASIGYGGKVDFTQAKKELPSVGKYHLPSIWDRY